MITLVRKHQRARSQPKEWGQTMINSTNNNGENPNGFTFRPALLKNESAQEFEKLLKELNLDIQPQTFTEQIYVDDIANLTWEILRWRRVKAGIVGNAFRPALENALRSLPRDVKDNADIGIAVDRLARAWFSTQAAKDKVSASLKEVGLDEWAVEVEALRSRLNEIEKIDRLIASAEARRDKALRTVALYRESFSQKLQESSDRLLDPDHVPSVAT
jgi:hypothetical protein